MHLTNVVISSLLCLLTAANAYAEAMSCKESIGEKRAQMLVQQCIHVSPATHPPCNASNNCNMIIEEIDRGCGLLGKDADSLNYCSFKIAEQTTLSGVLIGGGGLDNNGISLLTDDGRRVWGYCDIDSCSDDLFVPEGEDGKTLNPALIGKLVSISLANEPNKSRIAGPDENETLLFVKKVQFVK